MKIAADFIGDGAEAGEIDGAPNQAEPPAMMILAANSLRDLADVVQIDAAVLQADAIGMRLEPLARLVDLGGRA